MKPEYHAVLDVPEPEHSPDRIGGPVTNGMVGRTFFYRYPTGLQYRISFSDEHAYFTIPRQEDDTTYIGLPYRSREIRPDVYLVSWLGPGRQSHITLVFDLAQRKVDAAALMPGLFELFDRAVFEEMYENGQNALWNEDPRA